MGTTINERIKAISDEFCNGNISELSRITGINQPALRDIVGTKQAKPGFEILSMIVDTSTLNISGDWILTGKGEMLKSATEAKAPVNDSSLLEKINSQGKTIEILEATNNKLEIANEKLETTIEKLIATNEKLAASNERLSITIGRLSATASTSFQDTADSA